MHTVQASPTVVRFGVFEADLRTSELRKCGVKVRIQDLPFHALVLLLSRPGEVVSREDFRRELWPDDVFVDFDRAISSAIKRLRDALRDSADNPVFIETIERHGYRWIAPTHVRESSAEVIVPPVAIAMIQPHGWLRWSLLSLLPVLALLFALWTSRPSSRSAKAGAKPQLAGSSGVGPLHRPPNQEAEDFYLKGRFYWNKRTPESLNQAVDSFTQAIVRDPNYAAAYVGLADCYNLLREYTLMPASEAYPRAYAAAKKAVELDPQSSEAHASLAFVSFYGMWDTGTADQEFQRSIDLDPRNSKAHHWYATYLEVVRRYDESLIEIDRAQALDPNSPSILADKGRLLWMAGRRGQALQLLKQVEAAEPDFVSPHRYLKAAYLETGDYLNYLFELKKEAVLCQDAAGLAIAEAAAKGFAAGGAKGMFTSEAEQEQRLYYQGKVSPYIMAETYSKLGNSQDALKYLALACDRHVDQAIYLASNPAFSNLHGETAFQQLVARIGLPPLH
jgi:DNA-binding winged helix-turn-helix (wHTH) protein/tetratricopeptide (TPR) repeat protein